jgi:hypothetical protein
MLKTKSWRPKTVGLSVGELKVGDPKVGESNVVELVDGDVPDPGGPSISWSHSIH